ncbi:hypothetical protein EIK77_003051 [Talaromyces pinophilus]|nr:hypothetical protein EIK77_003051 [Talaromyces pinophilus]
MLTDIAARWNFVNFQGPSYSAWLMEFTTPPSYGSTVVSVGGVVKDDKILYAGSTNTATHLETHTDSDNDWPEPKSIKFTWDGKGKEDNELHAELEGSLGKRLDRIDVMYELPGFVKSFVGSVAGTKPYIYQVSNHPSVVIYLANSMTVLSPRQAHAQSQRR